MGLPVLGREWDVCGIALLIIIVDPYFMKFLIVGNQYRRPSCCSLTVGTSRAIPLRVPIGQSVGRKDHSSSTFPCPSLSRSSSRAGFGRILVRSTC